MSKRADEWLTKVNGIHPDYCTCTDRTDVFLKKRNELRYGGWGRVRRILRARMNGTRQDVDVPLGFC